MNHGFLLDALIYLAAAILFVPLAKRFGLSSILGYLLAGVVIGPDMLGLVGGRGEDVMHFAELGVVLMLFLIGLELEPAHFWGMRRLITGAGLLQLSATTLLFALLFRRGGFSWQEATAVGLALSMSSTAIVLQTLREKGWEGMQVGRHSFAVLLFQDMAVVPILIGLPLLALAGAGAAKGQSATLLGGLPGWAQTLALLCAVGLVALSGRYVIVPFLRFIGRLNLRELFTAAALFIVIAAAYLMELVGLSPALGTFLAGVLLANSEYRHELESDIEPFKGILLGLFFISVGAATDFGVILSRPLVVFAVVLAIVLGKALILFVTGKVTGLAFDQNLLFTLALAQVGEFAFVLISFMYQLKILGREWADTLMGATALSMALTPILLLLCERSIIPAFCPAARREPRQADRINEQHPVILAGFGHFGSTIGRFLRANGIEATILDNDSERVELLRRMGFKVFYGDATRVDILKAAGADKAKLLIAAIGSPAVNHELVEKVRTLFPGLKIMVRAENRYDAYEFLDKGIKEVYRETLHTAVRMGVDVLVKLGFRRYSAHRAGQNFLKYDEAALEKLAGHRHDKNRYIFNVREQIRLQEELLASDRQAGASLQDHAWDSDLFAESAPEETKGGPAAKPSGGGPGEST